MSGNYSREETIWENTVKGGKFEFSARGDLALFVCNGTKVNKYSKFDTNFDIQRQLDHFEYEMIHALKC